MADSSQQQRLAAHQAAQQRQQQRRLLQPAPKAGGGGGAGSRVIVHVDMDCFFAAVAALGRPQFKGVCRVAPLHVGRAR